MVLVPLNQRHTEAELRYALEDSGARVLFSGRPIGALADCVEHVDRSRAPATRRCWAAAPPDDLAPVHEDALAGLFYTGGTTGAAKGVMLSHRNLVANAFHFLAFLPFGPDTVWLIAAPLFHAAGSIAVLATVWNGGHQVVLPAFDPAVALDLIETPRRDRHPAGADDAGGAERRAGGPAPRGRRPCARSATAVRPSPRRRSGGPTPRSPATELVHIYGATELAPIATTMRDEEQWLATPRIRSCGQPAVGVEIAIVSPDGVPVPAGEVGEVVARGPNVMAGYWNKPEATAQALAGGWYHTGDLGYQDEEAFVYLVDRAKDMIVTGGENVYSTEVEDVLYRHPAVLEAAVFAVPDDRWGEAVHAVVVLRSEATEAELVAHCRADIAGYKVPKRIELRDEPLPKSGAGKVLKRELREPYWQGRGARVGG